VEGFFRIKGGIDSAIARGLAYAPYADLLWFETSEPSLEEATKFAAAIHEKFPGKLLAYNCSPSFNWKKKLDDATIARFQQTLGELGYKFQVGGAGREWGGGRVGWRSGWGVLVCVYPRIHTATLMRTLLMWAGLPTRVACGATWRSAHTLYACLPGCGLQRNHSSLHPVLPLSPLLLLLSPLQFVTLAGFHSLNFSMFTLAHDYAKRGMAAYAELQEKEFAAEKLGYSATTHQRFVGTGYFDQLAQKISEGLASTTALTGSTEEEQFH
jgi:hypothetical protein